MYAYLPGVSSYGMTHISGGWLLVLAGHMSAIPIRVHIAWWDTMLKLECMNAYEYYRISSLVAWYDSNVTQEYTRQD